MGTQIIQQVVAHELRKNVPAVWIETPRFRVTLPLPAVMVVLETRDTPTDEWSKTTWQVRKEDIEFQLWAISEYKKLIDPGLMENDVPEEMAEDAISSR